MKKFIALLCIAALALSVSGCGGQPAESLTNEPAVIATAEPEPESPGREIIEHYNDPKREGAAFLEEISPFEGELAQGALSPQAQQLLESQEAFSGLSANCLIVDGTPLYEVWLADGAEKPLVIVLHGGGGSKDDNFRLACALALQGLHAVCIDAAGCGDSKKGPIDALACFAETVYQMDSVIEYYNTVDGVDAANFGIVGGSMGGNVAFAYMAHGLYRPAAIQADQATPDYTCLGGGPLYDCFYEGRGGQPNVMSGDEINEFARRYSPINWPERFLDTYILASNGTADEVTSHEGCMALEAKLKELGGNNFSFNYFEGYGHEALPPVEDAKPLARYLLDK